MHSSIADLWGGKMLCMNRSTRQKINKKNVKRQVIAIAYKKLHHLLKWERMVGCQGESDPSLDAN